MPLSYLIILRAMNYYICAYRHGRSTEDILSVAVDTIVTYLDKGDAVCAAFLDLRKAFDSLDHCTLLCRLSGLGVSCAALHWFKHYLTDRHHRVKCQNQFSSWQKMKGGIPQGSLPSVITDRILLQYADDTTLICSSANSASTAITMNYQLQLVHSWIADSKMELNSKESSVMWFMPRRCRHSGSVERPDIVIIIIFAGFCIVLLLCCIIIICVFIVCVLYCYFI